jgi:diguanylate cyclase (GGDEF)-like protein
MDVPPLDPNHILTQVALVFAAAFTVICGITAYLRAHPPRKPDGSPIEGHLRTCYASSTPFVLILAAPPTADGNVAHLWHTLRGAVRAGDYLARLDEHRMAFVAPLDRAGGHHLAARLSTIAQSGTGPAFCLGLACVPGDGADPAALTAAATDRLVAALHSGRLGLQLPPMTERPSPREVLPVTATATAARELDRFVAAGRRGAPISLLYAEIDQLGKYGEQYGAGFARQVLDETCVQARASVRGEDYVAEVEGNRLMIALLGAPAQARAVAGRLVAGLRRTTLAPKGASLKVTVSVGLACLPEHAGNAVELADMAYAAMNVAKGSGGNTQSMFEPGTPVAGRTHVPRDVF